MLPEAPKNTKKVYIETHGCQMNEYDSRKMADVLAAHGAVTRVFAPEEADILLANTCSVREKAQEKVFSELGRWRELKQQNPNILIGVGGCVASQEGEAILQRAPFVDVVFGPQTLHRLPELIAARQTQKRAMVDVSFPEIEKFDKLPEPTTDGPTAFVSIMEGCSKYCTYCVVPYTRGAEISRPLDDVIVEIVKLAEQGVREITLLGQNVNGYFGKQHDGSTCDFAELLYLVAEIEGIERIRFTTSHPLHFDARQIQAFKDLPKLANYIHLPVQAGNDRVLGAMKRGYTVAQYEAKIAALRAVRPNISISTDFIVGFPTETEQEFEDTMALIGRVGFDQAFSFMYSPRPGTPAAMLVDNIPLVEKKRRLHILQARIAQFGQSYRESLLGSVQTVLVERDAKRPGQQCGRLGSNHIVNFACDPALRGKFVQVNITGLTTNSFIGEALLPMQPF